VRAVAAFLVVAWAAVGPAQEATYIVDGDQLPIAVAFNGFVQSVTRSSEGTARVQVAAVPSPIGAEGPYVAVAQTRDSSLPRTFDLPPDLRSDLRPDLSAWEAATRVLEWVAKHVQLDAGDSQPQDAVSVLARGSGRCSGLANATTALLMAAGFEAKTVSGLLITDGEVIPHRWVACRLPVAGWVATDPTLGLWAVTPGHVAFADTVEVLPEIRVIDAGEDGLDRLPRRGGRPLRPNLGSELVCRIVDAEGPVDAVAILNGSGQEHRAVLDPEGRFSALLPGRWRLVVIADGEVVEDRQLDLEAGQVHSFNVSMRAATGESGLGS
jgi:hypothetical protein